MVVVASILRGLRSWQGETQQDEDASFLLDERGGGRWWVGKSGLVFRDALPGLLQRNMASLDTGAHNQVHCQQ